MANIRLPEINKVLLIGRATKDGRLFISVNGTPFCIITVANNRNYKDKNTGEWERQTNFIDVQIIGSLAQNLCDQIKKGTSLFVEGFLATYKKDVAGKPITHTLVRAQNVKILSISEEDTFSPPEPPNDTDVLPPIGDEDEELPF